LNVEYRKTFLKDLTRIPSKTRMRIEIFVFSELCRFDTIDQCNKIERMSGYPSYYKIRFGDYRIGMRIEDNVVILERVLHRKEIYRFFP
jgi:mRNA interferase RelE/StbE